MRELKRTTSGGMLSISSPSENFSIVLSALLLAAMFLSGGCRGVGGAAFDGGEYYLGEADDGEGRAAYSLSCQHAPSELMVKGESKRTEPYLGLMIDEIDPILAKKKELKPYQGILVDDVTPEGPAFKAGVLPGDVILKIDDTAVIYAKQLVTLVKRLGKSAKSAKLTVLRSKKDEISLNVAFGERAIKEKYSNTIELKTVELTSPSDIGVRLSTLPREYAEKIFGIKSSAVLVSGVVIGSPAYLAGLRSGDRVLSVNNQDFASAEELERWFAASESGRESLDFKVFNANYKLGESVARVPVENICSKSYFKIPFLFDCENSPGETETYLGLTPHPLTSLYFYEGEYFASGTRRANYHREFGFAGFTYEWSQKSGQFALLFIKLYKSTSE